MTNANHKVRERCMVCEGSGREAAGRCAYCAGSGYVFAVTGAPKEILVATGDCKIPVRKKFAPSMGIERKLS